LPPAPALARRAWHPFLQARGRMRGSVCDPFRKCSWALIGLVLDAASTGGGVTGCSPLRFRCVKAASR
jgi:hypothetical protein